MSDAFRRDVQLFLSSRRCWWQPSRFLSDAEHGAQRGLDGGSGKRAESQLGALTRNLLKCLPSTSNGRRAAPTNHIPHSRSPHPVILWHRPSPPDSTCCSCQGFTVSLCYLISCFFTSKSSLQGANQTWMLPQGSSRFLKGGWFTGRSSADYLHNRSLRF